MHEVVPAGHIPLPDHPRAAVATTTRITAGRGDGVLLGPVAELHRPGDREPGLDIEARCHVTRLAPLLQRDHEGGDAMLKRHRTSRRWAVDGQRVRAVDGDMHGHAVGCTVDNARELHGGAVIDNLLEGRLDAARLHGVDAEKARDNVPGDIPGCAQDNRLRRPQCVDEQGVERSFEQVHLVSREESISEIWRRRSAPQDGLHGPGIIGQRRATRLPVDAKFSRCVDVAPLDGALLVAVCRRLHKIKPGVDHDRPPERRRIASRGREDLSLHVEFEPDPARRRAGGHWLRAPVCRGRAGDIFGRHLRAVRGNGCLRGRTIEAGGVFHVALGGLRHPGLDWWRLSLRGHPQKPIANGCYEQPRQKHRRSPRHGHSSAVRAGNLLVFRR